MGTLFKSGVLVLTYMPRSKFLYQIIEEAAKCVNRTLYIDLLTTSRTLPEALPKHAEVDQTLIDLPAFYNFMSDVYRKSSQICSSIDVRVLLPPASTVQTVPRSTAKPIELCIGNTSSIRNLMEFEHIVSKRYEYYNGRFHLKYLHAADEFKAEKETQNDESSTESKHAGTQIYPGVVIGGTFDRMHNGHKLLIGAASLFASKKLTVGVANGKLLNGKVLEDLIEPVETRIIEVEKLIEDLKPGLDKKVVPIDDPAGPSGTDDDLQLLVVSQETSKGGIYVNRVRNENNLQPLDVFVIDMLEQESLDLADGSLDHTEALKLDTKLSSSNERIRDLGILRKEPQILARRKPYIIGLTGGIATGKSAVTRRLQRLGASAINCDKLGHQAYQPGTLAYEQLINKFGRSILNEDGTINRRTLGSIAFSDKSKLNLLNQIVWPEIARMVEEKIEKMQNEDVKACVIEAAVLLEAGWDRLVNEVWVTTVPIDEAVKRITERDGYNEIQARIRIEAQMSSKERISKSHVVISTLWQPEFTQKIVEKAWKGLLNRIENFKSQTSLL